MVVTYRFLIFECQVKRSFLILYFSLFLKSVRNVLYWPFDKLFFKLQTNVISMFWCKGIAPKKESYLPIGFFSSTFSGAICGCSETCGMLSTLISFSTSGAIWGSASLLCRGADRAADNKLTKTNRADDLIFMIRRCGRILLWSNWMQEGMWGLEHRSRSSHSLSSPLRTPLFWY